MQEAPIIEFIDDDNSEDSHITDERSSILYNNSLASSNPNTPPRNASEYDYDLVDPDAQTNSSSSTTARFDYGLVTAAVGGFAEIEGLGATECNNA